MRIGFLEQLRCPLTGHALQVETIEHGVDAEARSAVRTGILWSEVGGYWYPIINHVPIMLTFETPLASAFARQHAESIVKLPGKPNRPMLRRNKVSAAFKPHLRKSGVV